MISLKRHVAILLIISLIIPLSGIAYADEAAPISTRSTDVEASEPESSDNTAEMRDSTPQKNIQTEEEITDSNSTIADKVVDETSVNKDEIQEKPQGMTQLASGSTGGGDESGPDNSVKTDPLGSSKYLKNNLRVGEFTGAAIYDYPLNIPPGRNGMTPSVSLTYNSQNSSLSNIAGYRWDINMYSIKRFNKNGVEKMYNQTDFVANTPIENGEIIATKITSGQYGKYAQKVESNFSNYEYKSDGSWVMTDKSGTKYTFGKNTSARQSDPADSKKIYQWMLEEIRDTNNNFIRYTYSKNKNQIYPKSIYYTGHGTTDGIFEVKFNSTGRTDKHYGYSRGFRVDTEQLINSIELYVSNKIRKKYDIGYTTVNPIIKQTISQITETGYDTSGLSKSLPPVKFEYTKSDVKWQESTKYKPNWYIEECHNYTGKPSGGSCSSGPKHVISWDMTGDGLTDFEFRQAIPGGYKVVRAINDGNGGWKYEPGKFLSDNPVYEQGIPSIRRKSLDFDGDIRNDLIQSMSSQYTGKLVTTSGISLNSGKGYSDTIPIAMYWDEVHKYDNGASIADLNGDGLPDIIQARTSGIKWTPHNKHTCLNTDGSACKTTNLWQMPFVIIEDTQYSQNPRKVYVQDCNMDGLADILNAGNGGNKLINDGKGNFITPGAQDICSFNLMDYNIQRSADFNGDGILDQIHSYKSHAGTGWTVTNILAIASGGAKGVEYNNLFPVILGWSDNYKTDMGVRIVDLNGDLLPDVIHSQIDNMNKVTKKIYMNKGSRPYFLKTVTNPQGGKINLEYKTSAQYTKKDGTQANPNLPIIVTTVNKITHDNGFGNKSTTEYFYEDGHYYYESSDDREMAGFRIVTKTDAKGNIAKNYYHQGEKSISDVTNGENDDHISKKGLVYRSEIYDNKNNLRRLMLNKWAKTSKPDVDADDDRFFVYLKRTTDLDYGENKKFSPKAVAYVYDGYGNVKEQINYGIIKGVNARGDFQDSGTDKITTTTNYAYNTAKGIRGAPTQAERKDYYNKLIGRQKIYYDNLAFGQVNKGNTTKNENYFSPTEFVTTKTAYNNYGLVTDTINPRNYKTTIIYDSFNLHPSSIKNAKGHITKYEYDYGFGVATKVTDPNNAVAETIMDELGRAKEVKVKDSSGKMKTIKKYSYDLTNSPTSATENVYPNNKDYTGKNIEVTSKTYFDGFGRTIQKKTEMEGVGKYNVTSITYDELGNVKKEFLPKNSTTLNFETINASDYGNEYTYDVLSRVKTIKNPVGKTWIDYHHWRKRIRDANGKVKYFVYDARGNLTQVNEYTSTTVYPAYYTYDANNNLIKIKDAEGNIKNMTYDFFGRTLKQELLHKPSATNIKSYKYTYDKNGNIQSRTDAKSQVINYKYDELDRVTSENTNEVIYKYDTAQNGKGKIASVNYTGGSKAYNYDILGNITDETKAIDSKTWKTSYEYDIAGNITKLIYPDNTSVSYEYNNAGQVKVVPNYITKFYYNPIGAVSHTFFKNGVATVNSYDPSQMYRLKRKHTRFNGVNLQNIWYKYDAVGNIKILQDYSKNNAAKTAYYTYDDLHRLTKAQITSAKNGQNYTRTYKYSGTGNILNKSDVGNYEYSGSHPQAVTKAGGNTFKYDANGSMTSGKNWTHTYDKRGRLVKSEKGEIKGKILSLNMDDGKGAKSFADSSGSKGSVPCIGSKCPVWAASKSDSNYEFNGISDYLTVPDNTNLGFTNEYTLSAWVNPDTIPIYAPVFVRGSKTGDDIEVYIRKDGLILAHNRTNGGKFSYTLKDNLPDNPPSNRWSHFVITWTNNKWKVYMNGVLKYTSATKENPINTGKWYIGKTFHKAFGTNNAFDGKMNDIAIFDKSLTKTEVSSMYTQSRNNGFCSSTTCPTYTTGKLSGAYDFDGIDDFIELPKNTNLGFTKEYTLSAWVNPDVIKNYAPIFTRSTGTGDDIEVYIRKDGLVLAHNRTNLNAKKFTHVSKWNNPPAGKWSHLAVIWKDKKWKLYLNGELKHTSDATHDPISTGKWYIGKSPHKAFGTSNAFDGKMDEIAFFNRALTDVEVTDIYKGGDTKTITYSYDEGKERVMKNEDGKKTYYVNKNYEEDKKEVRKFIYANDVKVASLTKPINSSVEKQAFHHADHLGSSNIATNNTGKVVEVNDYYPYGDTRVEEKDASYENDYLYTGKELDRNSGLYYYGARYYDPSIGRFTGVDPVVTTGGKQSNKNITDTLQSPQMMNGYSYAGNNPLKYTDPTGESLVPAPIFIDPTNGITNNGTKIEWGQSYTPTPMSTGEKIAGIVMGTMATGGILASYILTPSVITTSINATSSAGELVLGAKAGKEATGKIGNKEVKKVKNAEKIIQDTRSKIINSEKAAASMEQMKNLGHRIISPFRDAAFKAKKYGGKASDYIKQSSHKYESSDGLRIEIHSIKNTITNKIYELKSVIQKLK